MKRIFTEISAFAFIVAVLFSAGCLSDDLGRSDNGSGTGSTEPTIPDNSVIDAGMFSALNLDYPGLAAVKAYYDSDQYYLAAQALLEYYRGRTDVINGNVNLIDPRSPHRSRSGPITPLSRTNTVSTTARTWTATNPIPT